jgi:hypothetical protein
VNERGESTQRLSRAVCVNGIGGGAWAAVRLHTTVAGLPGHTASHSRIAHEGRGGEPRALPANGSNELAVVGLSLLHTLPSSSVGNLNGPDSPLRRSQRHRQASAAPPSSTMSPIDTHMYTSGLWKPEGGAAVNTCIIRQGRGGERVSQGEASSECGWHSS